MIKFDYNGDLCPYTNIPISTEQFVKNFILSNNCKTRRIEVWQTYKIFIRDFRKHFNSRLKVWIYGSFVTSNQVHPDSDIDILIFIPEDIYRQLESIEIIKYFFYPPIKYKRHIDPYFYWILDKKSPYFDSDSTDIEDLKKRKYCKSKKNKGKGCIELNYPLKLKLKDYLKFSRNNIFSPLF